ncbi:MAG: CesT family type III secretion system chaperone [Methylocystaceae bacterium]|nr:CesT family type III secretion system chaperone [Methylocystaceae bacterium]
MFFDDLLARFGESLGMQDLCFDERDRCEFEFERLGHLQLEKKEDHLSVALSQTYDRFNPSMASKALAQSHFNSIFRYPVRAGLSKDERLVFFVQLDQSQADLSILEQVLDELSERFRQLAA